MTKPAPAYVDPDFDLKDLHAPPSKLPVVAGEFPKTCTKCGHVISPADWELLQFIGWMDMMDGTWVELRNDRCTSTIGILRGAGGTGRVAGLGADVDTRPPSQLLRWDYRQQSAFEDTLVPGMVVIARWTSSNNYNKRFALVVKKNRASTTVRILDGYAIGKPLAERTSQFPVPLAKPMSYSAISKFSWNNCLYPLEHEQRYVADRLERLTRREDRNEDVMAELQLRLVAIDAFMEGDIPRALLLVDQAQASEDARWEKAKARARALDIGASR